MIEPKKINEFIQHVLDSMPEGLKNLPEEVRNNLRAGLQSAFNKMDLVTREEFDAQMGVLQKTRQKLEELEKTVETLEKQNKE